MIFNEFFKSIIKKYFYNFKDTGSTEIQIILLTLKIEKLKIHLKNNKKDRNSKRSYFNLTNKRLKLLKYLKKKRIKIYFNLISDLNI